MATLPRHLQQASAPRGAIRHRASDVEAAGSDSGDLPGLTPLLARGIAGPTGPLADRRHPVEAASVLALQRVHGNAHVQRLIAQRAPARGKPKPAAKPLGVLGSVEVEGVPYMVYTLGSDKPRPIIENANALGFGSFQRMQGLMNRYAAWRQEMAVVHSLGDMGYEALEATEKDKKAVGDRSEGRSGAFVEGRVKGYLDGVTAVKAALGTFSEKQGEVEAAVLDVHKVTFQWDKLKAERNAEAIEGKIGKEEAALAERRANAAWAIGVMEKTADLVNPAKWVGLASDALITFGKDQVTEALATTPKLEALRTQLSATKAGIKKIDDRAHLAAIAAEAKRLEIARKALEHAGAKVEASYASIRLHEKRATEALGESRSTRGAAGAIAQRGKVVTAAMKARPVVSDFVDNGRTTAKQLWESAKHYRDVRNLVDEGMLPDTTLRMDGSSSPSTRANADHNFYEVAEVRDWLVRAIKEAKRELAFLEARSYMQGYDGIPAVLQSALENR